MPRSVFLGRPMPAAGEPLFLTSDTLAAIALAEEEADQCPQCGMPKAWCRDNKTGRARFDVEDGFCWAAYRVALRQKKQDAEKLDPAMRAATLLSAKFRNGQEPDLMAGLLGENDDPHDDEHDQ